MLAMKRTKANLKLFINNDNSVELDQINTEYNQAGIFTKPLYPKLHNRELNAVKLVSIIMPFKH